MSSTSGFNAVIVGGSVAGLSLAHCFEKAGISYTLLEARDTISPQLGAGIVIMPNAARILDQLGLYDRMSESIMTKMGRSFVRRADGRLVSQNDWPDLVQKRMGYPAGVCERRRFLQSLYDQLKDKSRIVMKKKVITIVHEEYGVIVKCEDGSEFRGDCVIGADGVHSKVRGEMQKFAEETGPKGIMEKDKASITAEYKCFFGLAHPLPELTPGDSHVSRDMNISSLLFVANNGLPQWFLFCKLDKKYDKAAIPRFTKAQMEADLEEYADFHVAETLTMKELMKKTHTLSYLALEEGHHEFWSYGRFVCLGDSIHKMTPNLGQGGNQSIESAAVLTNCLVDMLTQKHRQEVNLSDVKEAFQKYQSLREARAKMFVRLSGLVTRDDALETLHHTLRFLYFPLPSGEILSRLQIEMYQGAPYLSFLPLPPRLEGNEIWQKGVERVKNNDTVPKIIPQAKL